MGNYGFDRFEDLLVAAAALNPDTFGQMRDAIRRVLNVARNGSNTRDLSDAECALLGEIKLLGEGKST